MAKLHVALSSVVDGNMMNRHDPLDADVIRYRTQFLESHGFDPARSTRLVTDLLRRAVTDGTDFCTYAKVDSSHFESGMTDDGILFADALITTTKNHTLILPVADCIGAVIFDPEHNVLMLSHLGRHSLEVYGAERSVQHLAEHHGSDPSQLKVHLTPAAGQENYPLWALDNKSMKQVAFEQLQRAGVLAVSITDDPRDTTTDHSLYSYSEFLKGNRKEDGDHMIAAVML